MCRSPSSLSHHNAPSCGELGGDEDTDAPAFIPLKLLGVVQDHPPVPPDVRTCPAVPLLPPDQVINLYVWVS